MKMMKIYEKQVNEKKDWKIFDWWDIKNQREKKYLSETYDWKLLNGDDKKIIHFKFSFDRIYSHKKKNLWILCFWWYNNNWWWQSGWCYWNSNSNSNITEFVVYYSFVCCF